MLVSDVLDTLVTDPFFNGMSSYFGFSSFQDFLDAKTPGLWHQFEKGQVSEHEIARTFFKDHRFVDVPELKQYLKESYALIPGIPALLQAFQEAEIEVHLCTNYPVWAELIEDALHLTTRFGVHWTFISGKEGIRKPDKSAFWRTAQNAGVAPSDCVFLDDSEQNCKGAIAAGFLAAIHFRNPAQAGQELSVLFARHDVPFRNPVGAKTSNTEA